jgi:hypothetical protein
VTFCTHCTTASLTFKPQESRILHRFPRRVVAHLDSGEAVNEPVIESWYDLCDYGAIGAALHLGLWPKIAPPPFAIQSCNGSTELFVNGEKVATIATEAAVKLILGAGDQAALLHMLGDAG